ncbi:MAG: recombinase family protein [Eubacterium sp.]|nr:recombinase family protein [Eubacterium sp.]
MRCSFSSGSHLLYHRKSEKASRKNDYALEGLISRIVVKKYDRFSRDLRDHLNVSEELDKLGVTVYSLSEPFNTETKEDKIPKWVVT